MHPPAPAEPLNALAGRQLPSQRHSPATRPGKTGSGKFMLCAWGPAAQPCLARCLPAATTAAAARGGTCCTPHPSPRHPSAGACQGYRACVNPLALSARPAAPPPGQLRVHPPPRQPADHEAAGASMPPEQQPTPSPSTPATAPRNKPSAGEDWTPRVHRAGNGGKRPLRFWQVGVAQPWPWLHACQAGVGPQARRSKLQPALAAPGACQRARQAAHVSAQKPLRSCWAGACHVLEGAGSRLQAAGCRLAAT
jgi:hypothetical protein